MMDVQRASRATTLTCCILGLGLIGSSCMEARTIPNPNHCANNDGDQWCAGLYPDGSRPYCILGNGVCGPTDGQDGCVPERPEAACYSPCGGRSTIDENGDCLMEEESSGSSSGGTDTEESSGSTGSSTGPVPCMGNEDCTDAGAPFCEPASGECVGCDGLDDGDGACAELDASNPLCVAGACVACTAEDTSVCDAQALVCDEESNGCVPCTEHDQCGDAACNLFEGTCLPADAVTRVGPGQEHTTLGAAVMSFPAGSEGTIIVFAGMPNYDEAVTVDGGRTLAFLANEGDLPRWALIGGGSPQLTVGDATVLMDGIQVSGNAATGDPGVLVDGGRAWLDRSRIIQNAGGGIVAQNAGELVLRNCFVGGSVNNVAAFAVDSATATVSYSTIIGGLGSTAESLACNPGSTVTVLDSVILLQSDNSPVTCDAATFDHTASEMDLAGAANVNLGNFNDISPWFVNVGGGDFHLATPPASISTAALWTDGDPLVDIDGDARPGADQVSDVAGADVP